MGKITKTRKRIRPTLILGAMPSETVPIEALMKMSQSGLSDGFPCHQGRLHGHPVVVGTTGVGITNSAMCAALFIARFQPRELIFTGSGARINQKLRTGDVIIAKKSIHHCAGSLTDEGVIYRKVRGPTKGSMTHYSFAADPGLLKLAKKAAKTYTPGEVKVGDQSYHPKVLVGSVCSSDFFGVTSDRIADIRKKLGCDLMEMESSAVGQVCHHLKIPHLVIRSGSNSAQPDPGVHYRRLGQIAARQAALFTIHLMKMLADTR